MAHYFQKMAITSPIPGFYGLKFIVVQHKLYERKNVNFKLSLNNSVALKPWYVTVNLSFVPTEYLPAE